MLAVQELSQTPSVCPPAVQSSFSVLLAVAFSSEVRLPVCVFGCEVVGGRERRRWFLFCFWIELWLIALSGGAAAHVPLLSSPTRGLFMLEEIRCAAKGSKSPCDRQGLLGSIL